MKTRYGLTKFREDPKRLSFGLNFCLFCFTAFFAASLASTMTLFLVKVVGDYIKTGEADRLVPLGIDGAGILFLSMLMLWGSALMGSWGITLGLYKDILQDEGVDYDSGAERPVKMKLLGLLVGLVVGGLVTIIELLLIWS